MGLPSGANSRPPCAFKLCSPLPKYEFREEGGGIFWTGSALQHTRGIEFDVHHVLVYHRSPWGRRRQRPRNLVCRALTDWERGAVPVLS